MRVTVHLDSFDRLARSAYAIVWIDKESGKWSREGHAGIDLPEWGRYRRTPDGTCLVAGEAAGEMPGDLCTIEGLDLAAGDGPFEGEDGSVHWNARTETGPLAGHWHVQCVDDDGSEPEEGLFAN